jgi:hypothetical protein
LHCFFVEVTAHADMCVLALQLGRDNKTPQSRAVELSSDVHALRDQVARMEEKMAQHDVRLDGNDEVREFRFFSLLSSSCAHVLGPPRKSKINSVIAHPDAVPFLRSRFAGSPSMRRWFRRAHAQQKETFWRQRSTESSGLRRLPGGIPPHSRWSAFLTLTPARTGMPTWTT